MQPLKLTLMLLLVGLLQSCQKAPEWQATDITGMLPDLAFSLTGPDGSELDASALLGKPALIFFGFTSCPDVCPTTLTQLSVIMSKLGPKADKIQVVLVTVDPGRDTPDVMQKYTASPSPSPQEKAVNFLSLSQPMSVRKC